jgi:hypothetical protein
MTDHWFSGVLKAVGAFGFFVFLLAVSVGVYVGMVYFIDSKIDHLYALIGYCVFTVLSAVFSLYVIKFREKMLSEFSVLFAGINMEYDLEGFASCLALGTFFVVFVGGNNFGQNIYLKVQKKVMSYYGVVEK